VFSIRRRHTSCYRYWSSDVCSSDLFIRVADPPSQSRDNLFSAAERHFVQPDLDPGDADLDPFLDDARQPVIPARVAQEDNVLPRRFCSCLLPAARPWSLAWHPSSGG